MDGAEQANRHERDRCADAAQQGVDRTEAGAAVWVFDALAKHEVLHLFGQMADMDSIMEIARSKGLPIVEDACQAHGAEQRGRRAGSIGIAGAFSFYPGKNLGAAGEAGAVVTNDDDIAQKIRMLRDHGQEKKYIHRVVGWNARMDGIQGAILSVKLRHLEEWNEKRNRNANTYRVLLSGVPGIILPFVADGNRHVYHVYAIRAPNRDTLLTQLRDQGINCAIHYPVPIHIQKAYENLLQGEGSLPICERIAKGLLSLPMYAELGANEMESVSEALRRHCS
jgi:dTDP-4-amino-4,6-dideoxygalactose transaminase